MANLTWLLVIPLLLLPHLARAASFTPLGLGSSGAPPESNAGAVSDDGAVVVGRMFEQGFRWSGGVMTELGSAGPTGLSADGSVMVGYYFVNYPQAFRWSGGVETLIPILPGNNYNFASGVSADGQVVVGTAQGPHGSGEYEAYRWANGALVGLGFLPNTTVSSAQGVSADGEVVVGSASAGFANPMEAFRWENGVMSSLGGFPEGTLQSSANAASADGAFVVGSMLEDDWQAFRWTNGEVLGLGYLAGHESSYASDVSADGSVVVGGSSGGVVFSSSAFIWTEADGMQRLMDVLIANGATGLEGWTLGGAGGVSADGRWIVGSGVNPDGFKEAFLADISPVPAPATFWLLGSALAALAIVRR